MVSKHKTAVAGLWGTLISAGLLQEKIFKKPYLLDNSTSIFFNSSNVSSNLTSGANETSEFSDFEHYKDSQFIIFFNRFFSALLAGFFLLFQAEFKSRLESYLVMRKLVKFWQNLVRPEVISKISELDFSTSVLSQFQMFCQPGSSMRLSNWSILQQ